jgi:hypothetical protein
METQEYKKKLFKNFYQIGFFVLIVLLLGVAIKFLFVFRSEGMAGGNTEDTIAVTGHGEVSAVPDVAEIDFTIREDAKTVKDAEDMVTQVEGKTLALLNTDNVAEKDIKTESVSFNPKYSFQYSGDVVCGAITCPPRPTNEVITGYEAYESISVKVRNTDDTGEIIQGLGTLGITELSGPNFTIDNEDTLKTEARRLAINDAKDKAKVLAKDLGIRLGKITSFNDNSSYPPVPMYATNGVMGKSASVASAPAVLPTGENTITSDVTITYEIR